MYVLINSTLKMTLEIKKLNIGLHIPNLRNMIADLKSAQKTT